ncbi:D-lactate dehydrogenase [Flavobacteriaceae bacterium]|nr:D-lactate dehydrogenase [Flavobacteriaceae bacterium]MDB4024815.1 D-lactate dehydrogenase [Flavobacteriaceae bacterium]MDB4131690.1 D-lactate dehydrogenase [Flavobacteriaceae bacterium]MDC0593443.1 D-lactate dehydrogenase [Flavobacteriaceae bacterium]MDC1417137.1 D-lactate dehydrogenase [Flavobacteriaceae bacterium]
MKSESKIINELKLISGDKYVITSKWGKEPFSKGWRYGEGETLAVVKPGTLLEIWKVLQKCVEHNVIVIMQAANTGLTGGSTPFGNDYDRSIVIINTLRINSIQIIENGKQIIALPGSSLYDLENKLKPLGKEPHSVIGSSSIGASIVGGVCNNSGGSLVHRGPAYTEFALYAKVNEDGKLELVNELDINLGSNPEEILLNLENNNYTSSDILKSKKLGSDDKYSEIVRGIDENTAARFNADNRLLYSASGSAGKIAVFALRLDTYKAPEKSKVFYVGSNNQDDFWKIRREILSNFKELPRLGDYMHRDCYDAAKKYSKDSFIVIEKLGTNFLPSLFEFKRIVDIIAEKVKFLPEKFSDKLMQFLSNFWPNHLPKKMEAFRDQFEHHWIIEMTDEGINEAEIYFKDFFKDKKGDFFVCNSQEGKKAMLHRYVSASAIGRYQALNKKNIGEMMSLDIAFPRNEKNWLEILPQEINDKLELKFYYGHLFCHVFHHNYILKKGVDAKKLKKELLEIYDKRGAEYPAEHNVGHEYKAMPVLTEFYKKLDPTNFFNPGIGQTSKLKNWK